ncbi:unnamed protein product [Caretta caretta]
MEGMAVNLVNIYAMTSAQEQVFFFLQASSFLGSLDPRECLGGDFNTTLEEQDCSWTKQCPAAADVLQEIVDHHSLVEVWCDHHPDNMSTFTYVRVDAHRSHYSRLHCIYYLAIIFTGTLLQHPAGPILGSLFGDHDGLSHADRGVLVTDWAKSLGSRVLPLLCRRAVLSLLLKKGDLCNLWNWHPVSLLSTDYKVIVKAISLRLEIMLADVVHPDQTYTIPGSSIFDNLYLVRDILELGCGNGLSFSLLSLDHEKEFDRVDHGYLLGTLWTFVFEP